MLLAVPGIAEQAMKFFLDCVVAFTGFRLQSHSIKDRDVATTVTNKAGAL
jgi:hypothetical protein